MSTRRLGLALGALLVVVVLLVLLASRHRTSVVEVMPLGVGVTIAQSDLDSFLSVMPDGRGLPLGRGTSAEGAELYATTCASCHGEHLEGDSQSPLGGPALVGGRGSLATAAPLKTVESFWPYATTLFDYTKRAMPLTAPGSLSNDDVYSLVAFILSEAKIIPASQVIDRTTLPQIHMPNRGGFVPDPRPEHYR